MCGARLAVGERKKNELGRGEAAGSFPGWGLLGWPNWAGSAEAFPNFFEQNVFFFFQIANKHNFLNKTPNEFKLVSKFL